MSTLTLTTFLEFRAAAGGVLCPGFRASAVALMEHERPRTAGNATADSDSALIRVALAGDGDGFARLVERYQGPVSALLWHFTRDRRVLEELVQDTFVEAYLSLRRFRDGAPFYPWLRTIATRVGYRHWRHQRRERDREAVLAEWRQVQEGKAGNSGPSEAAEAVHNLLALLPPKDRLLLTLQYFEGCNTKEMAERMGWSTALVKVRAFRARQKLKALLLEAERDTR